MTPDHETLRAMYWNMLLARRTDERAWILHRQGKIAFHISGIGQEAAQVAAAMALEKGVDWVVPYYRDLAMMIALGYTPLDFMLGLMGKRGEPTSGARQMPSHWSLRSANIVSHSSPVATQAPHASGIGLGIKLRGEKAVVLTSIGEGSTSQGEWYEAVNWAAIHKLPVIFMIENNVYAISVHSNLQMAVDSAARKADGLGLPGVSVDGLDPLIVYAEMTQAVTRARAGEGPTVIEVRVSRMTPHSSDDDDRSYRPREEVEQMKQDDPLPAFEKTLREMKVLSEKDVESLDERARAQVEQAVADAESAPYPEVADASYPVYVEDMRNG